MGWWVREQCKKWPCVQHFCHWNPMLTSVLLLASSPPLFFTACMQCNALTDVRKREKQGLVHTAGVVVATSAESGEVVISCNILTILYHILVRVVKHFPCQSWSLILLVYALSCFGQEKLTLKAKQEEVLTNLYDGRDVFAWFPTGYGKSLCYQLLPFLLDFKLKQVCSPRVKHSVVIIISSLVSLMVDQVVKPSALCSAMKKL